jgi:hypothetical protein
MVSSIQIVSVGIAWFLSSAFLSTWSNTTFLLLFKDPSIHVFIRFTGSALCGSIALYLGEGQLGVREYPSLTYNVFTPAVLLWLANFANSYALETAGITLTYVVKACIPVFTVIICTFQGQRYPLAIYASLVPICFGVALASGSDVNFSVIGLFAALISALAQTFMNIIVKSVKETTGYSGPKLFFGMCVICTAITFLVLILSTIKALVDLGEEQLQSSTGNVYRKGVENVQQNWIDSLHAQKTAPLEVLYDVFPKASNGETWPLLLLLITACAFYSEYGLNFIFVGYVSSVAFSVCDIARRVAIIVTGAVVFQHPLTASNWLGKLPHVD